MKTNTLYVSDEKIDDACIKIVNLLKQFSETETDNEQSQMVLSYVTLKHCLIYLEETMLEYGVAYETIQTTRKKGKV